MNTRKTFSLTNAIKFALNNIQENIGTILFLGALALGIWALFTVIMIAALSQFTDLALVKSYIYAINFSRSFMTLPPEGFRMWILSVMSVIQTLALLFTTYQMTPRFAFGIYNKKPLSISELLSFDTKKIVGYIGALTLAYFKLFFGMVLLIVPGIYYAGRYFFAGYSILDGTTQSITEDTKNITNITQGVKLKLVGIFLVFNILPLLILKLLTGTIIPNVLLVPVTTLMYVHIYEQLKAAEANKETITSSSQA